MPITRLPLSIHTLYQQLIEHVFDDELSRNIGYLSGMFVSKVIKGSTYWYLQYREAGTQKQLYLGLSSPQLEQAITRFKTERPKVTRSLADRRRLCAMLRKGGMIAPDAPSAHILSLLERSGVFKQGAILVGTHAFQSYANLLGVQWTQATQRTQDIDLAQPRHLSLAITHQAATDLPDVLAQAEMGFIPIPALTQNAPSTSFKVRGKELKLDLLAPLLGRASSKPIPLPALNSYATPLRFLDYLIEDPIPLVLPSADGIRVTVPQPARFALHKLIVAHERGSIEQGKRRKDLLQAEQMLEVLLEDRLGDIELAWENLAVRGENWIKRVKKSLAAIENSSVQEKIVKIVNSRYGPPNPLRP